MLHRFKVCLILVLALVLFLLNQACEGSSLGMTVHVVPLDSSGGNTVRAHFTAITSSPCPDLSGLCSEQEDCLLHSTPLPFIGSKPSPWCVRQWQETVPSDYTGSISLGVNTDIYVSLKAEPTVRGNNGRLNQPVYVALPPPLRARVNCPHHIHLSVKDLDGDRVRCRFAQAQHKECVDCTQLSFIQLDEEKCMLTFTGEASAGQYSIYLMAEDWIPGPRISYMLDTSPLSSVPVHLSLTVEESDSSCSDEPVASVGTPEEDTTLFVLPFQEVAFKVYFMSEQESVLEIPVVGPPGLYRDGFISMGYLSTMSMAWVRSDNKLTRLLPICFAANTKSLQSEPRCVWLYQREISAVPAGTELECGATEMTLVLPVSSLKNVDLDELQLNSPTCPVTYNSTHLTAHIPLDGCGTKAVHAGSELIYTNVLQSVRPYTMVSRQPLFFLPVACRIPSTQLQGLNYNVQMPKENQIFGEVGFKLKFYLPGKGPMAKYTESAQLRSMDKSFRRMRRDLESVLSLNDTFPGATHSDAIGSRINQLDLHVFSNCTISRAELIVSQCLNSETEDFAESTPILQQGCASSNSTLEVITPDKNTKIYRLDLSTMKTNISEMYVQCTVNLCIASLPSHSCPDLCSSNIDSRTSIVNSVFTKSYKVTSEPVSLVYTTPAPSTATSITQRNGPIKEQDVPTTTVVTASTIKVSGVPKLASSTTMAVILTTISIFLH